ncbi:integral membrane protein S linking to the trans Golgi network-domain-containing protein [Fusarium flagelliforme]|uniref:integral membrane protein S linking to the trans Golgi network-domain-containing protein n=1 Tax=Fusarium flagelliforme TaxID=2675880 RepID=UPI001E8CB546|nr:integral membrane protein S linking to the trans Golgi network-domain-containing protein [Fusarium flagelliforme]KAH7182986.1 integral membrane protein S linking to the trans Golgi network-domain-containing protein [Fusarium flagelliforme]
MPRRRKPPRAGALAELAPLKIAGQIATLQAIYYFAALVLIVFTALVSGSGFSWTLVFGWEGVRGDTTHGWLMSFILLLDGGLIISIAIVALIARSKLVPDFALTVHFLHLIIASLYSGRIPRHGAWWLTMLISSAISVSLGIWGCQYRELQPLFFGGRPILSATGPVSTDGTATQPSTADEEMAIPVRGRGRDGGGEYEMAPMQPVR